MHLLSLLSKDIIGYSYVFFNVVMLHFKFKLTVKIKLALIYKIYYTYSIRLGGFVMSNKDEIVNKKKANTLLVITIITFATMVIGAAYAYFKGRWNN